MKRSFALACLLALGACSGGQTPGQLFCQFQTAGGGTAIVGIIDGAAAAEIPGAAPVAILATNMGKDYVDKVCAQAAANQGGSAGTPVSPPPAAVGSVAVVVAKPS